MQAKIMLDTTTKKEGGNKKVRSRDGLPAKYEGLPKTFYIQH